MAICRLFKNKQPYTPLKHTAMKKMELTLIIQKGENNYYVGQLQEYPAVLSQGKTIEELKTNIADALKLYISTNISFN